MKVLVFVIVRPKVFYSLLAYFEESYRSFGCQGASPATSECIYILEKHKSSPIRILQSLFALERVSVKQRNDYFCQISDSLASKRYRRISCPSCFLAMKSAYSEDIFYMSENRKIIVSQSNANSHSSFYALTILPSSEKYIQASFAVEEAREPITEIIWDGQSVRNTFFFNPLLEGTTQVDFVKPYITTLDILWVLTSYCRDFGVRETRAQEFLFSHAFGSIIKYVFPTVAHFSVLDKQNYFVRCNTAYDKVIYKSSVGDDE